MIIGAAFKQGNIYISRQTAQNTAARRFTYWGSRGDAAAFCVGGSGN